jgi:hypothetical protein
MGRNHGTHCCVRIHALRALNLNIHICNSKLERPKVGRSLPNIACVVNIARARQSYLFG